MKRGVLIVAYSPWLRSLLTEAIASQPDMAVAAVLPELGRVRETIREYRPDVLLLDLEMPHRDSVVFIEELMLQRPMPVVVAAPLAEKSAYLALRALEVGAADFISSPAEADGAPPEAYVAHVAEVLRGAARARFQPAERRPVHLTVGTPVALPAALAPLPAAAVAGRIVVVGASTGGAEALRAFVSALPPNFPPVVVAQPMPALFSRAFARRLDSLGGVSVRVAAEGEPLLSRHVYIIPGDRHLTVERAGSCYVARLSAGSPAGGNRPSVDLLFASAAEAAGEHAVGVILTGSGSDGAAGMAALRRVGAFTIAQRENECLIPDMPREAVACGAVAAIVSLADIPRLISLRLTMGDEAIVPQAAQCDRSFMSDFTEKAVCS